ncbi:hypothetical protein LCGC14_1979710 [marine sediment metagenome]|uniref:VWFA domain-containing protein n=1 Tax=marine sediment metagenome TaxID=412755 RepID=A0A0F9F9P9_9ZZZZ
MRSKSKFVNSMRQKDALTYNLARTHSTSLNSVVDLFFIAGASRTMPHSDIFKMLEKSWVEDKLSTLKVIFWAGDIRGGAGERRFFRLALNWLEDKDLNTLLLNLYLVPEYNRWDSLFQLDTTQVMELIKEALYEKENGLCAKWMPRKKQYDNFANRFRNYMEINHKTYRDLIVKLSNTVEQKMCAREFKAIEYKKVPSCAMNKYRTAFYKKDESRFSLFLEKVEKGEEKIHAGAIFPYQIYKSYHAGAEKKSIIAQWKALPDYMADTEERIIPVCDVSGSMTMNDGLPMAISVSLGIYLSERNRSIFKDAFITFSGYPKMQYLKGDLISRIKQLEKADWDMNTDLNKVFELILGRAVEDKLKEKDMPSTILIISDMEFDRCGSLTNFENIENKYSKAGYKIPKVVFWNVSGRSGNVPVSYDKSGVALVSGASPSIIKAILSGKDFTPQGIMLETIENKRYDAIKLAK